MTADRRRIIYEGEFERGRMQGHGTYYYAQAENSQLSPNDTLGSRYIGEYYSVVFLAGWGSCVCIPSKVIPQSLFLTRLLIRLFFLSGEFKENMRNGFGKYFLPDGSVYDGQWREGMMSGRGIFTWPDHSIYDGEWKNGKRYVYSNLPPTIANDLAHTTRIVPVFLFFQKRPRFAQNGGRLYL